MYGMKIWLCAEKKEGFEQKYDVIMANTLSILFLCQIPW